MQRTSIRPGTVLFCGLALFSMFFGAGNVIFPPFLGLESGSQWVSGFAAYFIADIGLNGQRPPACSIDFGRHGIGFGTAGSIVHYDIDILGGQIQGNLPAQAARCAGNDGGFTRRYAHFDHSCKVRRTNAAAE